MFNEGEAHMKRVRLIGCPRARPESLRETECHPRKTGRLQASVNLCRIGP